MRTYHGERPFGAPVVEVTHDLAGASYELVHIERHSPDGFEWGFDGSGPRDLAYAILSDSGGSGLAEAAYRTFATRVIAQLDTERFLLTDRQIGDFLVSIALDDGDAL